MKSFLILTAIASLTIAPLAHAGMMTLRGTLRITASISDAFEWDKLRKDNDQGACNQFLAEHETINLPAVTVVFLETDEPLGFYKVRVRGSSTVLYAPIDELH